MRVLKFFTIILLSLLLTACSKDYNPSGNLVVLETNDSFTVENNGQRIAFGEDVTFFITMKSGFRPISCNYSGEYELITDNSGATLCLKNVQYPTRISLQTGSRTCKINYSPNGGTDKNGSTDTVSKISSLQYHLRPNTENGSDLFFRDGYTLTSWNTKADGTGENIGLGSRITLLSGEITLYARWEKWSASDSFTWEIIDGEAVITSYTGNENKIVLPGTLEGSPVTTIRTAAFKDITATSVVLCPGLKTIEPGAFDSRVLKELVMFDDLETFSDASFAACDSLMTLRINAVEAPYGYLYRKESVYADKVDMLILAEGQKKMIFYGGCSMWYNLDGNRANNCFGSDYRIINMGLNGTSNSAVQLQIMSKFTEPGDILFHTPELSSVTQLMVTDTLGENDSSLWCGIENNYDLFALVDLRTVNGVFDSFCDYLSLKTSRTDYSKYFADDYNAPYVDSYGCIPFYRSSTAKTLADRVTLGILEREISNLGTLCEYYNRFQSAGVNVYVSYTCLNLDGLDADTIDNISSLGEMFAEKIYELTGKRPVSSQSAFLYHNSDFYDTNYHLLSEPSKENTDIWLAALKERMIEDGLWEAGK